MYNKLKEFLSENFKRPTYSRWVVFFVGIVAEGGFSLFVQSALHKDLSRFIPFLIGFSIYWFILLCVKNIKNFLALSALCLFPFNRFLILRTEQAFILGRISDYLLITIHLFEIPLYIYGFIRITELIQNFRINSLTVNISRRILLNPLFFSFTIFFVSLASAIINHSLLEAISRLQILIIFSLFYLILHEISYNQLFGIISFSAVLQSLIGILQVIANRSIGLAEIGESVFNEGLLYISKSMIGSTLRVRTYGTFPHPNILSGFLLIALVIICFYFITRNFYSHSSNIFSKENIKLAVILTVILLCLYLGQSRTVVLAIVSSIISILVWIVVKYYKGPKGYMSLLFIVTAIGITFLSLFQERINSLFTYDRTSFSDRIAMQDIAINAIKENPVWGLGPNGYLNYIGKNKPLLSHFSFIVEPAHNAFLLLASEIGIASAVFFGLYLFVIFITAIRRNAESKYFYIIIPIIFYLLLTLNLDHYLITLKQGSVIFAISLFLILYERKSK